MRFNQIKSKLSTAAVNLVEAVVTKSEPVIEAGIEYGDRAHKLAGSLLLGTIHTLDYAEQAAPRIRANTKLAICRAKSIYQSAVAVALVVMDVVDDLADPWKRLFADVSVWLQENGPDLYTRFKDGLVGFYLQRWGKDDFETFAKHVAGVDVALHQPFWAEQITQQETKAMKRELTLQDLQNVADHIDAMPCFTPDEIQEAIDVVADKKPLIESDIKSNLEDAVINKTIAASKPNGYSMTIVVDESPSKTYSVALPDNIRGLKQLAKELGGIEKYGNMSKGVLKEAVIKRMHELDKLDKLEVNGINQSDDV